MSGFDPNYTYLIDSVSRLLKCFTAVWDQMCKPFIPDFYMSTAGGNYYPTWSYLLPLFAVGFAFISIGFTKKLIFMLIDRGDNRV